MPHSHRKQQFDELYRDTFALVYAYCLRRVDQRDDVDDVVSEVYASVWRRLDDALGAETPIAWIYGIAYRTIGNQRRSRSRGQRLSLRLKAQAPAEHVADPSDIAATRSELAIAEAALQSLGPIDQELLRLSLWDDLSNPEIAVVLDLEPDAVRSKLFRARQRFQAALEIDLRDESAEPDTNGAGNQDRQGPHSGRTKGTSQ